MEGAAGVGNLINLDPSGVRPYILRLPQLVREEVVDFGDVTIVVGRRRHRRYGHPVRHVQPHRYQGVVHVVPPRARPLTAATLRSQLGGALWFRTEGRLIVVVLLHGVLVASPHVDVQGQRQIKRRHTAKVLLDLQTLDPRAGVVVVDRRQVVVVLAPVVAAVAVQAQAGDQLLALQAHPFGRYHKGTDERLLAHLDLVVGRQQRHQVLAGDAPGRPPRARRLGHVEAGAQVHVVAQELVLQVRLAQAVEVLEQVGAGLGRHTVITFLGALAQLLWKIKSNRQIFVKYQTIINLFDTHK